MRLLICALLPAALAVASSAPAQQGGATLDQALAQARAEQARAESEVRRLEQAAARARDEAGRLSAERAAAAEAIAAGEARITAADAQLRLVGARVAALNRRLAEQRRPVGSLLASLAMMAQRPPLLAIADRGSTDEFVKVRVLLDSTLPAIRARTAAVSHELEQGRRLERAAAGARAELLASREALDRRRRSFAALEQKALAAAAAVGGQAVGVGDVAIAAGEDIERMRREAAHGRSAWSLAAELGALGPAPPRPVPPEGRAPGLPFAYELPAVAAVIEGFGSVDDSGVRSRGVTLATPRGALVEAPAAGTVRFSSPYRSHDGIVIIDHGRGWLSLIVNVASPLKAGQRVRLGSPLGRALGPLGVELSQNGRRISPALIAGSSQTLSKGRKDG